jgi:choline dehydrogenase
MTTRGYGVIVIGAGSAGSVLVGELAAARASVLLLEAGGPLDAYPQIRDPNQINCLYDIPQIHWGYKTTPQANLNQRVLDEWRAKVMGGCSSHNDMVYTRGARGDFDAWAKIYGCSGWDYDSVAPSFAAVEKRLRPSTTEVNAFGKAFLETCVDLGIPFNSDYNSGSSMRGASLLRSTIEYQEGYQTPRRVTSFDRYVKPVMDAPNLEVVAGALVTRVILDAKGRATGVEYVVDGRTELASAGEVVLCAGAINSPKILMLSGVGNPEELAALGIPVVADIPAVGTNMQNAIIFLAIWKSAQPIKGQPANEGCAIVWDNMIDDDQPMTCLEMLRGQYTCNQSPAQLEGFYGVTGGAMRLLSKGVVTLASNDPAAAPIIDPRLLAVREDYDQCLAAYSLMLKVGNAPGLADWRAEQIDPAPETAPADWLLNNVYSYSHPVGTCAMGSGKAAVVDPETLTVRGLAGLRVADVSIMPRITSGHTQGPAFMIGHRAAKMILGHSG